MKKQTKKATGTGDTIPLEFMVPFALPENAEECRDQEIQHAELRRIIAGWQGAKWEPWGAPKSIRLPVPKSLAPLSECMLSDMEGDTLDELRLFHLAHLSAFRLYQAGRTDKLAELGLFITRCLEGAKEHFPDAERKARESFGAWPVELKVGSKGARVPDLGRSGCRGWNLKPSAFAGDSDLKRLALGLYGTLQTNRELFRLVDGRWKSLARWCKANSICYPLLVPVWADDLIRLPDPPSTHWREWTNFITRDLIREIMGQHPAWLRVLSDYDRGLKRYKGKRTPENLAASHLKKYLRDLLHTETA